MGFFRKNQKEENEKTYTYNEVIKLMNRPGYENYVAIPLIGKTTKYLFVPEQREQKIDRHREFVNRMSENGAYANNRNYNNYQQTRGYRKSKSLGFEK